MKILEKKHHTNKMNKITKHKTIKFKGLSKYCNPKIDSCHGLIHWRLESGFVCVSITHLFVHKIYSKNIQSPPPPVIFNFIKQQISNQSCLNFQRALPEEKNKQMHTKKKKTHQCTKIIKKIIIKEKIQLKINIFFFHNHKQIYCEIFFKDFLTSKTTATQLHVL